MPKKQYTFLVGILNWGLGHATRSVPIIKYLTKKNIQVVLAAEGRSKEFLKIEFPDIQIIELPTLNIRYPKNGAMAWEMAFSAKKISKAIKTEHEALKKTLSRFGIDAIISDNRYGLWAENLPSILLTHQLNMHTPGLLKIGKPIVDSFIHKHLRRFDEIWVPDFAGNNSLSGKLSVSKKFNEKMKFIGPLSRFDSSKSTASSTYDILVTLSGPEPQRTILEKTLISQIKNSNLKAAILLGKPENGSTKNMGANIDIYSHLGTAEFLELLNNSGVVISRPGYSTIMDLLKLGKKAIFIPTPGQTEQEYLAKYYAQQRIFPYYTQKNFNLKNALSEVDQYSSKKIIFARELMEEAINRLIEQC